MNIMILYIGPGIGVATIAIITIILLIVIASLAIVLMRPIKKLFMKLKNKKKD